MSHKKDYIPGIYIILFNLFKDKSTNSSILFSDIREIMNRRLYAFSRQIHYLILEEMCSLNLIKKLNRNTYQINLKYAELKLRDVKVEVNE